MKKLAVILAALLVAASVCSCRGDENGTKETTKAVTAVKTTEETEIPENEETTAEVTTKETTTEEIYSNKIYYVGDDIPEGTYVVNCTKSEYGMDVVIFKSETEYTAFQNAEKFTNGEYCSAVEQHAWADFYIEESETAYIALESGNIILLDDGMCEFSKHDMAISTVLHSGIYIVGKDIDAGNLNINCTTDYLQVVVFENTEKYSKYHKSSRFTNGEESDAIEANSASYDFIYEGYSTSVNLKDGMILMIDDGIGEYSVDNGPVIN